jgi:ribosomal protein L7/L12
MRFAFLAVLSLGGALAAADPDKTPPAVRNDYDRAQAAVVKLLNDFQKAAQKEADHLVADLTKELKDAMKKGDLDGANAINAKLEEIKTGAWLTAVQRSWLDGGEAGDLLTGNLTPVDLVGKWTITASDGWTDVLLLRDGGKITSTTDGELAGTWTITKTTVAISCTGDHAYLLSMTQPGLLSGKGTDVTVTMKRMR